MNVTLQRVESREEIKTITHNSYEYGTVDLPIETDYTGRWKIVNINEESTLFIECFEIVERFYFEGEDVMKRVWVEGGWFAKMFGIRDYEYITVSEKIEKKNIRANVTWIPEDKLLLSIETINECECNDD